MLRPAKRITIRSDIHGLWLANKNDLWYSGGGAFQPWTFGFNGRPSNGDGPGDTLRRELGLSMFKNDARADRSACISAMRAAAR
jgi:hypothetical protein